MSPSLVKIAQHVAFFAAPVMSCSNFIMENDYGLSARTMDLGTPLFFGIETVPKGSTISFNKAKSTYGFVGFPPHETSIVLDHFVSGGLNDAGLSCDQQTLLGSEYPKETGTDTDLSVDHFCEYMLASCATVPEAQAVLANGTVTPHGPSIAGGDHFVLRDVNGASLVVEFLDEKTVATLDNNDGGTTGYGVMTNEPQFDWHVENMRHAAWKLGNARPSFTIPGAFYPDERFVRINLLKSAMDKPTSYEEAVMQTVHVLNSVTVPMGDQMGTDSSKGEGAGDHTKFGVIYDHKNQTLYWRAVTNQNFQRLRLADANLDNVSAAAFLPFSNDLPWYNDAASAFVPTAQVRS